MTRFIQLQSGTAWDDGATGGSLFSSTKRCHACHDVREIKMSEREYVCFNSACQWRGDRDLNAAIVRHFGAY